MIRFEISVLAIQCFVAFFLILKRCGFKNIIFSFAIGAYTPGIFITKFIGLPSSMLLSIITIIALFRFKINKKSAVYCLTLFLVILSSSILNGLVGIIYSLYYLVLILVGFSLFEYWRSLNFNEIRKVIKHTTIFVSVGILATFMFRLNELTLRDVGMVTQVLFLAAVVTSTYGNITKFTHKFFSMLYLFMSQTRSFAVAFFLSFFFKARTIQKKIVIILIFTPILASILIYRFINSANLGGDPNDLFDLSTRFSGMIQEYSDFLEKPLFGNSVYYYRDIFKSHILEISELKVVEYIAYNHNLITGTLAQLGILGLMLLFIFPILKIISLRGTIFNNFAAIFLISFYLMSMISGSAVKLDFDIVIFFFSVFHIISSTKNKKGHLND